MRSQHGFTLLELMVAMAIFAMLAVAGWQVFDSVNRARERAQFHADNLAVLQYAYLQLQQDMAQIIAYQAPNSQKSDGVSNPSTNDRAQANTLAAEPFMSLEGERVSFVRFADPDPRYQSSTSVQHIDYVFADGRLIRRQYASLAGGRDSVSLDSVLLEGVSAGRWQAYLPEISAKFPNDDASTNTNKTSDQPASVLLPKGIAVNFTYQDMPITWQWALAPQALPKSRIKKVTNNDKDKSNDDNNGNDGSDSNSANGNLGIDGLEGGV